MVFSLVRPARETYLLWHRFKMPTKSGPRDAVAVSSFNGDELISAYTFILEHIVIVTWGMAVVVGVLMSARQYGREHPSHPISTEIYTKRASPLAIIELALKHFLGRKPVRWLIAMWMAVSIACLAVKYAIPIVFAKYIKIGTAAPVNPRAIFVPSRNNTDGFTDASNRNNLKIFDFYVPSALRAVGNIDSMNKTQRVNPPLSIDQPETIGIDQSGGLIMQLGYRYNVTGLDFGLQHYPDLLLSVEGFCVTEYGWWAGASNDNPFYPGAFVEQYVPFNNPNLTQSVSLYDGGPRAFFFANGPDPSTPTNSTWASVISSVNRTSWFPSTDPWYQTAPNPFRDDTHTTIAPYMVIPRRPALSCWENAVWTYQGHTGSVTDLGNMPGLNLPPGLVSIFTDSLGIPMIYLLGTYLQVSALKSSVTALSNILDGSSSSIYSDLERLVYASYIATINCLTETTLFPPADGFLNDIAPGGVLLEGAGDFVIFGDNIVTLSVRALIIIPVVAVGLWILSITIILLPFTRSTVKDFRGAEDDEADEVRLKENEDREKTGETFFGQLVTIAENS
ncbi:hypothetical protein F5884DRAFT_753805 [Xylogone sp. PMI_703]|nr:hypothetical protein F5884DRAFT_753805 [Xylogone sp. PMI_703]